MGFGTSTIGVIGGMGPEATNRFCSLVTTFTSVSCDQEHIPVIAFSNPTIPSRVEALQGTGVSPVPELIRTARVLEQAGADFLVMTCNIAHHFIDDIRLGVRIPVLNMIEETARALVTELPAVKSVGILSSTPSQNLYRRHLEDAGCQLLTPTDADQNLVMEAIYGAAGIKCGYMDLPAQHLHAVAERLIDHGADIIISACTEVSVVMLESPPAYPVIDAMQTLAEVAIEKALSGYGIRKSQVSAAV